MVAAHSPCALIVSLFALVFRLCGRLEGTQQYSTIPLQYQSQRAVAVLAQTLSKHAYHPRLVAHNQELLTWWRMGVKEAIDNWPGCDRIEPA